MKSKAILLITCCFLSITLIGCDAFVRKFTRKSKKDKSAKEELVLMPEEYKGPGMSPEELYRQYFMFWKCWQDELIQSLASEHYSPANHKKQLSCADEAITNLMQLKPMLSADKQKELEAYITKMTDLREGIQKDAYGRNLYNNRSTAERLKRDILRDFTYSNIAKKAKQEAKEPPVPAK